MRVQKLQLERFKRFTDLTIEDLPETAKLVLVVGPNGSGKSSLFDAFIRWYRTPSRWGHDQDATYFEKKRRYSLEEITKAREAGEVLEEPFDWGKTVSIKMFDNKQPAEDSLYIRTAYRNDPEFTIGGISRLSRPTEELRVQRSIQNDQTVGQNYQRLVYDTVAGVYDLANNKKTVEQLRSELIGEIRASMGAVFGDLLLSDISDLLGEGTFYFDKGQAKRFNYKNLSGGEKAAFDLLLDVHIKRKFYDDAIWCIDELETHLHTRVQGGLMREIYKLVPEKAQLWLSTHSLGVMRAAQALSNDFPGSVALLDFDGVNPDEATRIVPSSIGRIAWEKMLSIAIDDLSSRVVSKTIVVCEGSSTGTRRKNFDAEIYSRVLGSVRSDVTFVSGGSSSEIDKSGALIKATLSDVGLNLTVVTLIDRDDRSDDEVSTYQQTGNLVLPERNIESYLFADEVLTQLAVSVGRTDLIGAVLRIKADEIAASVARSNRPDDLKSAAGHMFVKLRQLLELARPGNNTEAFMRDTLAPLIKPGMATHNALVSAIIARLPA